MGQLIYLPKRIDASENLDKCYIVISIHSEHPENHQFYRMDFAKAICVAIVAIADIATLLFLIKKRKWYYKALWFVGIPLLAVLIFFVARWLKGEIQSVHPFVACGIGLSILAIGTYLCQLLSIMGQLRHDGSPLVRFYGWMAFIYSAQLCMGILAMQWLAFFDDGFFEVP